MWRAKGFDHSPSVNPLKRVGQTPYTPPVTSWADNNNRQTNNNGPMKALNVVFPRKNQKSRYQASGRTTLPMTTLGYDWNGYSSVNRVSYSDQEFIHFSMCFSCLPSVFYSTIEFNANLNAVYSSEIPLDSGSIPDRVNVENIKEGFFNISLSLVEMGSDQKSLVRCVLSMDI